MYVYVYINVNIYIYIYRHIICIRYTYISINKIKHLRKKQVFRWFLRTGYGCQYLTYPHPRSYFSQHYFMSLNSTKDIITIINFVNIIVSSEFNKKYFFRHVELSYFPCESQIYRKHIVMATNNRQVFTGYTYITCSKNTIIREPLTTKVSFSKTEGYLVLPLFHCWKGYLIYSLQAIKSQ